MRGSARILPGRESVTFRVRFYLSFAISCRLPHLSSVVCLCIRLLPLFLPLRLCVSTYVASNTSITCAVSSEFSSPCVSVINRFLSAGLTARSMNGEFNSHYVYHVTLRTRGFTVRSRENVVTALDSTVEPHDSSAVYYLRCKFSGEIMRKPRMYCRLGLQRLYSDRVVSCQFDPIGLTSKREEKTTVLSTEGHD